MGPTVFVFTSDKYLKTLKGFVHLFNKYWDKEQIVQVIGFSEPDYELPDNFHFNSYGSQVDYPVNRWADVLHEVVANLEPNDRPIFMLEDYWLTRPVNIDVIRALWMYMRSTDNVLKMDLCTDRLYAAGMSDYGNIGFIDIIKSDPLSPYQMSLMTGIWNPIILESILRPGESPWDLEIFGTHRAAALGDNGMVLGTRQFPVRYILAHRSGDPTKYLTDGLSQSDMKELREIGVL